MSIEIKRRPYDISWSGNPAHYRLYSSLAAADASVFFEIKVLFKLIDDSSYEEVVTLQYNPVNGYANINIQDILDSKLEYQTPAFNNDDKIPTEAPKQTGYYYIQFREIVSAGADPSWDNSEADYIKTIVKGGIDYFKWRGNNFWVNYFNVKKPFLTWQDDGNSSDYRGRPASAYERMYLLWFSQTDLSPLNLISIITVHYTDGYVATAGFNAFGNITGDTKNKCYYIPAGVDQYGLNDPSRQVHYWTIGVYDNTDDDHPAAITELYTFSADNKNDYNGLALHYRNSTGGLDSARIRGEITENLNYEFTEQDKTFEADYFSGDEISPRRTIANGKERKVYKCDIGHVSKEEQDRLRDINLNRNLFWERDKKWWPVVMLTPSQKLRSTGDQTLWSFPIEFALAADGDNYYTPDNVDLGDGVFTENVCLAYLLPLTAAVDDGTPGNKEITIDGTEVDPQNASSQFRYRVLKQSDNSIVINWAAKNYTDLPFTFELPEDDVYILEYQAICTNNVYGKKSSKLIDTNDAGGGGGGGGPFDDSSMTSHVSGGSNFVIKINGVTRASSFIGAGPSSVVFTITPAGEMGAIVELTLSAITPVTALLTSDGNSVSPSSITPGGGGSSIITFDPIDIGAGGIDILLN